MAQRNGWAHSPCICCVAFVTLQLLHCIFPIAFFRGGPKTLLAITLHWIHFFVTFSPVIYKFAALRNDALIQNIGDPIMAKATLAKMASFENTLANWYLKVP